MLEDRVTPVNIGYYDMISGQGNPTQVASIVAAGHTPVLLTDLTAADLAGVAVIDVQNPDNGAFGGEYLSRLAEIDAAVAGGKVLLIHDRFVDQAETILPGGAGFNIIRDFADDANIDVQDNTTLVTNGPGGIVDNSTLDGGNSSSHGFAFENSLPVGSLNILSTGDPTHAVTFAYKHGGGTVIYSSIPLDFYLASANNFSTIYAPNVKAYAATNPLGAIPPTITDIPDQTIDEDGTTGALPFTIADGDTPIGSLVVTRSTSNPALVPLANVVLAGFGANRTVTATPLANQFGTATITITVDDGTNTTTESFLLTVNSVNDLPTVTSIADQVVPVSGTTGPLPFTIGDVETPVDSLTVTGTSSNPALVPSANVVFAGTGANRTVTVTPLPGVSGVTTISVDVFDGDDATTEFFTLTVNALPTISNIGDQTIDEDTSTGALAFTIDDVETPAGSMTVTGSSSNTTLVPISRIVFGGSGANRTVTVTPATNEYGSATITVFVTDGAGQSAQDTFDLTVRPINDAPIATILNAPLNPQEGSLVSLAGSQTDPDSTAWTYQWSVVASNGQVIAPASGVNFDFVPNDNGTYTVTLIVTDNGSGASGPLAGSQVRTINVVNADPNPNPAGPYKVLANGSVAMNGSAFDAAGSRDTLTFTWDFDGDGVFGETGAAATRGNEVGAKAVFVAKGFPVFTQYTAKLRVTDEDGGSATASTVITVFPLNYSFDFNASTNVNQTGFLGVRGGDLLTPTRVFGWNSAVGEFDNNESTALLRDGHTGADNTFSIRVMPGVRYEVTLQFRDQQDRKLDILAEGALRVNDLRIRSFRRVSDLVPRGFNYTITTKFFVTSSDGVLDLRFRGEGGNFVVNSLTVVRK